MSIAENYHKIKQTIPETVTLVTVSKTKPVADILEVYATGQRDFGENKVQEMCEKWEEMPKDIRWHMIGHLQSNKVKYMAHFVHLIHGVDSLELLEEINKQAQKHNRIIDCLLQIKIAKEETKFGLHQADAAQILQSEAVRAFQNIRIVGLMGMATFTENEAVVVDEFSTLKQIFEMLKIYYKSLEIISMGMSGDYELAIKEGSTMVRIGSSIFGGR